MRTRRPPRQDWGLLPGRGSCHGNPTTRFNPPPPVRLSRSARRFPQLCVPSSSRLSPSIRPEHTLPTRGTPRAYRLAQAPTAAGGKVAEARGLHSWRSSDLCRPRLFSLCVVFPVSSSLSIRPSRACSIGNFVSSFPFRRLSFEQSCRGLFFLRFSSFPPLRPGLIAPGALPMIRYHGRNYSSRVQRDGTLRGECRCLAGFRRAFTVSSGLVVRSFMRRWFTGFVRVRWVSMFGFGTLLLLRTICLARTLLTIGVCYGFH